MTRILPFVLIVLLGLGASQAMGQRRSGGEAPRGREALQRRLLAMFDTNHDGRLDRNEMKHLRHALQALRARHGETAGKHHLRRHNGDGKPHARRGMRPVEKK